MTEVADRYRRLADRFNAVVDDVPADGWDAPSPCEDWTARQVLEHVVESQHGFLARFVLAPELPAGGPTDQWPAVRDAMLAALDDPATADTEYDGMFGRTTLAETVDGFMSTDLVVHAWDIARATGLEQHEAMPADEVERLDAQLRGMGDAIRSPGAFGPEVPVPDDASHHDRFLGYIGRRP
jgi:uncharacterized protein (TIGR03086 family)